MPPTKKYSKTTYKNFKVKKSGKNFLVVYIFLSFLVLLLASLSLRSKGSTAELLAYVSILTMLLSIILTALSNFVMLFPLMQSLESERVQNIEIRLEKFYVPLYKLLTSQNQTTNLQEKINEIDCYIHLAEPWTRYRFKTYKNTDWFSR